MAVYFQDEESIEHKQGDLKSTQKILEVIANRYIGLNPAHPFVFRTINSNTFMRAKDGQYIIDFDVKHPQTKLGQYAYALGKVWCDNHVTVIASMNCYGPVTLTVNKQIVYKSSVIEEVNRAQSKQVEVLLEKGWNMLLVQCKKTASGFGCRLGMNTKKWEKLYVLSPFKEREGEEGWIYSGPQSKELCIAENDISPCSEEKKHDLMWFPATKWNAGDENKTPFERIYNLQSDMYAYAWSTLYCWGMGNAIYTLSGYNKGGTLTIWVDGLQRFRQQQPGPFIIDLELPYGSHNLLIESVCGENGWGSIVTLQSTAACSFEQPYPVKGTCDPWLYLGPFPEPNTDLLKQKEPMLQLYQTDYQDRQEDDYTYWRVDKPDTWVRPHLENSLFGRWSYPLGVTLYGLIETGREINRPDIVNYVLEHIRLCTKMYRYSVWDANKYGFPSINELPIRMHILDDCGSFGSAMLEANKTLVLEGSVPLAGVIAEHMRFKQERREDGAYYRKCKGVYMENTMWADDLYMSTPFLCRYYQLTKDEWYINDAVRQFLLYKKYLFMQDEGLMSHVYDFKYNTPTYVPWGRGNGWTLFSLSELLEYLPVDHMNRADLIQFFNVLAEGIMEVQGEKGLWHQVLNDKESYMETSCTAMFVYAFSRGVRFGWLKAPGKYVDSAYNGWKGLMENCINKLGDIYGVCMGSKYSFTADYYKHELGWSINDPHGIGIVMLAGIEVLRLTEWLRNNQCKYSG